MNQDGDEDDAFFAKVKSALGLEGVSVGLEALGVTVEVEADTVERPTTLDGVRELIGDCQRCKLCTGRTNIVFGSGPDRSRLMVIGEAPGEQEDKRGMPFVGPAGEMLDRMLLNVLKMKREDVYVSNTVKCRPKDNRDPEPDEISSCLPFLEMQHDIVKPGFVLLLGRAAIASTLRVEGGLKHNRGRWHSWRGTPTIATYHPAYLLRRPEDKPKALEDLKQLLARMEAR